MGLGSLLNVFKKSKGKDTPKVPPLDSRSDNIPKPNDPFSDSDMNSKDDSFGDLPDFPDFPGTPSQGQPGNMEGPSTGITPPKSIGEEKTMSEFSAPTEPKPAKVSPIPEDMNSQLDYYETVSNDKSINFPKVINEGEDHFVNIHDYKQVLEFLDSLKDNTDNFENSMMEIGDINNNCANLEDNFKKTIEDIQRKLIFVDKTLFELHVK